MVQLTPTGYPLAYSRACYADREEALSLFLHCTRNKNTGGEDEKKKEEPVCAVGVSAHII